MMAPQPAMSPVHFFSHGSTLMLGEESASATYWKKCGDEALANGIEHVVIMGAHWAALNDGIEVSANPLPQKSPVAYVHPSKYVPYALTPDLPMSHRVVSLLKSQGFNATTNTTFDWIHDTYLILIRMFPSSCPPTTIVSMNARYDPHNHLAIGAALRPLRLLSEKTLLIGSGGAVHNLYRNKWAPMLLYRDNFAMPTPPEGWAMGFRQEVEDAFTKVPPGPEMRKAMAALMKHPGFRDAHGTDDHFMAALFVAGLCGEGDGRGVLAAEDWELTNMANSQFTIGEWPRRVGP